MEPSTSDHGMALPVRGEANLVSAKLQSARETEQRNNMAEGGNRAHEHTHLTVSSSLATTRKKLAAATIDHGRHKAVRPPPPPRGQTANLNTADTRAERAPTAFTRSTGAGVARVARTAGMPDPVSLVSQQLVTW
jgi:hypothetical protein